MSGLLAEIRKDVSGFECQMANLKQRREALTQEISQLDKDLIGIQPLYTYAKNLLDKVESAGPTPTPEPSAEAEASNKKSRTAAATAASVAARKAKAEKKAAEKHPNA